MIRHLISMLALLALVASAQATDQVVTDPGDNGGPNQLRAKLVAAQSSDGGTITFNVGPAIIVLSGGILPNITTNIVIDGGNLITLSGNMSNPAFQIFSPGTLTLNNLTIANCSNSGDGGAVKNGTAQGNGGTLNINNCKFQSNNAGSGSSGGAIVTYGPLNISGSEFAFNTAGNGGAIYPRFAPAVTNVTGSSFHDNQAILQTVGWGGAMLLWDGAPVTIDHSTFRGNSAVNGGAFYIFANANLTLTYSTIDANSVAGLNGTNPGNGVGGGIFNNGTATISNSTISGNAARGGNSTTGGAGADGGGIFNGGTLLLNNSTVNGNTAHGAVGGVVTIGGIPEGTIGGPGTGAGLYNASNATVTNCTFSGNTATGGTGGGGNVEAGGSGGQGQAGGIYNNATLTLTNCTLATNSAVGGPGGISTAAGGSNGRNGDGAAGGILQAANGTNSLRNNLIATNSATTTAPDAESTFNSQGGNLVGKRDGSAGFTATSDKTGTIASPLDPQLDPNGLQNNGGPTATIALLPTSPAVDAATPNGAPANDQRGFPRVGVPDIGAFEYQPAPTPTPTPTATATPGLVGNVATRLPVGTGDNVLIEGFIVQGPAGSTKKIIVRAIGPSLAPFGIADALANPTLEIHDSNSVTIATNNDWRNTQVGGLITSDQSAEIAASGFAPSNDLESAIIANLTPGSYTAVVQGAGGGTGTGVVDAYDLSAASPAKLANIATRGLVQPGDKLMIAGFIIQNGSVRAVVRGTGPSLTAFGINNALPDTTLELHDQNGVLLVANDNWKVRSDGSSQQAEIEATGLQPSNDLESAFVTTLPPGQYTAQLRGKPETTGVGVVQVFFLQN